MLLTRECRWRRNQIQRDERAYCRLELRRQSDLLDLLLLLLREEAGEGVLIALNDLRQLLLKRMNLKDEHADQGRIGIRLAKQRVQLLLTRGNLFLHRARVSLELSQQSNELLGLSW